MLAGRSPDRLAELAVDLGGGLETAVADVARPETVRDLVGAGDVLIATVGPFARWGAPAAEAVIEAGAAYLDSTGEPAFIREVFESYGPRAAVSGAGMVTAFGYDWVPGNLAGALALREAGEAATRVDVGYFIVGDARGGMSGGTRASLAGALVDPAFAWRDGRLRTERGAARVRSFLVDGRAQTGVSVGSSEHFTLPRIAPGVREVGAYLGWFGPLSRPMQVFSAVGAATMKVPGRPRGDDRVDRAAREGLDRRPGRRCAGEVDVAHRGHRLRRGGRAALGGPHRRRERLRLHGPDPRLGRRRGGGRTDCAAPARWGRSRRSASTSSSAAAPRRGLARV